MNLTRDEARKQQERNQSGLGVGVQRRRNKFIQIERRKMISDEYSRRFYPMNFRVPFNPFVPDDERYDNDHPYILAYSSATTGYLVFKREMASNPEVLKLTCDRLRIPDASKLDLENLDTMSEYEQMLFRKWRVPASSSAAVISTQFSNRRNKMYPVMYRAECALDEMGQIILEDELGNTMDTPLFFDCYQLESTILASQIRAVEESYKEGGRNAHRSDKELENDKKAVWNSRLISRPFYKYAIRYLHVVCDPQTWQPDKDSLKLWKEGKIVSLDTIKLVGLDFMESLIRMVGTPKDVHFDYMEWEFQNPEIPKSAENNKGAYADKVNKSIVNKVDSVTVVRENPESPGTSYEYLEDFDERYRKYLDDAAMWNDTVTLSNVREFSTIKDEALLNLFQSDLTRYKDAFTDATVASAVSKATFLTETLVSADLLAATFESGKLEVAEPVKDEQDLTGMQRSDDELLSEGDDAPMDFSALTMDNPAAATETPPATDNSAEPPATEVPAAPPTTTATAPASAPEVPAPPVAPVVPETASSSVEDEFKSLLGEE